MKLRTGTILAITILFLVPTAALSDLVPYSQDFEGLDQADPAALADDGWLVYGNVFGLDWAWWYGYGPYPAPNGGAGFCGIDLGQGGDEQGEQQLVVYSDYNNPDQTVAFIEANTFQEQSIGAADVGKTYIFEFDAKLGNIEGNSFAQAFIKTLDPNNGWVMTNFIPVDMTNIPDTWDRYSASIFIDPGLAGQILQFGFLAAATDYQGSGIFYDNINFNFEAETLSVPLDIKPESCPNALNSRSRGVLPVALVGTPEFDVNNVDVSTLRLEGVAPIRWAYEDVATPFDGELCGCTQKGPDCYTDLTFKFKTRAVLNAIGPVSGSQTLTLTGNLLDGTAIEGQDCIILVSSPKDLIPIAEADGDGDIQHFDSNLSSGTAR